METPQTQKAESLIPGTPINVLITTYNYGRFIEETIDSVLGQEFPQDQVQIVVVDDGSTDDTAERLKQYGSRIEYFRKANGGQASALNLGIAKARGKILALLDADDLFLAGKLAREWRDFFAVSGNAREEPEKFVRYVPQPTSCITFRRSALEQLLPIPEEITMLADCYLVTLIPFQAPVLAVEEYLTVYRIHGRNQYTTGEPQVSTETSRKRLRMWQVVIGAMRK